MSTRRARIKAIATLPLRRKNTNNVEVKKTQDMTINEIKSPMVIRRPSVDDLKTSPARLNFSSPRRSPRVVRGTPEPDKSVPDQKLSIPAPVSTEKSTPVHRTDVFLSPRVPASPKLRSPIARTPVVDVDVGAEKLLTPHKRLLELQEEANKFVKLPDKDNVESPRTDNVVATSTETITDPKSVESYNSPNTPEPDVMDGIVPLKQVSKAPKPIDLLKSEIISENAEVVFDPIVPLPSPTKMRPKLRPVPRLGPIGPVRRNSIPGSASESEDESRRHHGPSTPVPGRLRHDSQSSHSTLHSLPNRDVARVRNDSACSMMSQGAPQTPALLGSPMKEKTVSKTRRQEVSRRMAALRRRKESIQRDKLTMYDLIFYNPLSNPIVRDEDDVDNNKPSKKEEPDNVKPEENKSSSNNAAPVPQIKLGPNGEIVLDEQSLVIKQSERELSKSVVMDNAWSASGRVYRKTPRTAEWTDAETVRFYRAIAAMGTDFSLMGGLFPGRTRRDLKLKFKKEEKTNMAQIDKALRSVTGWDMNRLLDEFTEERRLDEEQAKKQEERIRRLKQLEQEKMKTVKEHKLRQSKCSRALGASNLPDKFNSKSRCVTANDVIELAMTKTKNKDYASLTPIENVKNSKVALPKVGIPPNKVGIPPNKVGIPPNKVGIPPNKVGIPPPKPSTPTKVIMPRLTPTMPKVVPKSPLVINPMPVVPTNIAPGSLVVLTVDDPKAPTKKAIHTYIKQGDGSITSIVLNSNVMSSLVSLVKKDTPKGPMSTPSPGTSSRNSTPSYPSPSKRKRLTSCDIIEL